MLGNASPTQADLRFELGGIPVRIHPFFWLAAAMGGWNPERPQLTLLWIGCLFISILVHEMGHALMAQRFGWPVIEVCLYAFGGYAQYDPWRGYTYPRSIQVALAGPAAGFALFGVIWLGLQIASRAGLPYELLEVRYPALDYVITQMIWINLGWGLVNLIPVRPLDGGQVSYNLLQMYAPRSAETLSRKISIVAGGLAAFAFYYLYPGYTFAPILFVILTIENIMALQNRSYF